MNNPYPNDQAFTNFFSLLETEATKVTYVSGFNKYFEYCKQLDTTIKTPSDLLKGDREFHTQRLIGFINKLNTTVHQASQTTWLAALKLFFDLNGVNDLVWKDRILKYRRAPPTKFEDRPYSKNEIEKALSDKLKKNDLRLSCIIGLEATSLMRVGALTELKMKHFRPMLQCNICNQWFEEEKEKNPRINQLEEIKKTRFEQTMGDISNDIIIGDSFDFASHFNVMHVKDGAHDVNFDQKKYVANKLYSIIVYEEDDKAKYITVTTPQITKWIDTYWKWRKTRGEQLTKESLAFTTDSPHLKKHTKHQIKEVFPMKKPYIQRLIAEAFQTSGIRNNQAKVDGRTEIMLTHGLRKFGNTTLLMNGVYDKIVEKLMGHSLGLQGRYFKPDRKMLLEGKPDKGIRGYLNALDELTFKITK